MRFCGIWIILYFPHSPQTSPLWKEEQISSLKEIVLSLWGVFIIWSMFWPTVYFQICAHLFLHLFLSLLIVEGIFHDVTPYNITSGEKKPQIPFNTLSHFSLPDIKLWLLLLQAVNKVVHHPQGSCSWQVRRFNAPSPLHNSSENCLRSAECFLKGKLHIWGPPVWVSHPSLSQLCSRFLMIQRSFFSHRLRSLSCFGSVKPLGFDLQTVALLNKWEGPKWL